MSPEVHHLDQSRSSIDVASTLPPRQPTISDLYTLVVKFLSDIGRRDETTEKVQRKSSGALTALAVIGVIAVVAGVWLFKDSQAAEALRRQSESSDRAMMVSTQDRLLDAVNANSAHLVRMQGSLNALYDIVIPEAAKPVTFSPDVVTRGTDATP